MQISSPCWSVCLDRPPWFGPQTAPTQSLAHKELLALLNLLIWTQSSTQQRWLMVLKIMWESKLLVASPPTQPKLILQPPVLAENSVKPTIVSTSFQRSWATTLLEIIGSSINNQTLLVLWGWESCHLSGTKLTKLSFKIMAPNIFFRLDK